jgi:hypothetical protein
MPVRPLGTPACSAEGDPPAGIIGNETAFRCWNRVRRHVVIGGLVNLLVGDRA